MKVRVEEDQCVGDETCVEICPEIFEIQGDVAVAKIDPDEEVPDHLVESCKGEMNSCPVEAILVEEEGL